MARQRNGLTPIGEVFGGTGRAGEGWYSDELNSRRRKGVLIRHPSKPAIAPLKQGRVRPDHGSPLYLPISGPQRPVRRVALGLGGIRRAAQSATRPPFA